MKSWALVLLLTAASMGRASADPTADLESVRAAFGALHSVHAEMTTNTGLDVSVDWIEPNKVHVSAQNGMQMIWIGSSRWVNMGSGWRSVPSGTTPMQTQMAIVRGSEFDREVLSNDRISDEGMSVVRGIPAHKYRLAAKSGTDAWEIWVANNLPVQVVQLGSGGEQRATIAYSRYNGVTDFGPPI